MLNPFFLNGSRSEQDLIQSLVNEQLQMYGIEVYYLPRQYATTNTVIREVIESEFKNAYPIEAYVDNYDGYTGQGTILSKFGIENRDDLQLIISKERFEDYIAPLSEGIPNVELATRPKEGDLIYFPLGDRLFEIKFVEHEQPFYQLKKTYVYELRCELYRYEDEVIDTGVDNIDDEIENIGYIQTLTLVGAGRTATGISTACSKGAVRWVNITDMGKGYSSNPVVKFSKAPVGGMTATGIASVSYNYPSCDGVGGRVSAVYITNAGCGYSVAPWITIQGGGGAGAAATVGISTNGSIMSIIVTDGGEGYVKAPKVSIGQTASGKPSMDRNNVYYDSTTTTFDSLFDVWTDAAVAISTISQAGIVTDVYIMDGGAGYATTQPVVTFAGPGITTASGVGGSFIFNEVVTGSISSVTARVKDWDKPTNKLEISIIDGEFQIGEFIVGSESNAKYLIGGVQTDDLVTPFADNDNIEIAADSIIDFSQTNPFGMP